MLVECKKEREEKIAIITLNDPDKLNAMSEEMASDFKAVVDGLKGNENIRCVIITGAGRAFSAGGDLDMLKKKTTLPGEKNRQIMLKYYSDFLCARDLGIPLIAAINGHAIGAGLCLASACDIRIAAKEALLGMTFVRLGLHPGMGATYFLPLIMGYANAMEFMLTGRKIRADEALTLGLVNRVVDRNTVLTEALNIADEILECSPSAIRQLLETLRYPRNNLEYALQREALAQGINYASDEFKEGIQAVSEKRKPNF